MYTIDGEPKLSAKGHDLWSEMHRDSAVDLRKVAAEMPDEAEQLLTLAARQEGAADGHAFRAEELRYDARGGMTEEQRARACAPGAVWSLDGESLTVAANDGNGVRLDRPGRRDGVWELESGMTRDRGWRLVSLAASAR